MNPNARCWRKRRPKTLSEDPEFQGPNNRKSDSSRLESDQKRRCLSKAMCLDI
ncbi:hypothetical protein M407DRAFT_243322 [Tulasnella calospora MUT 4182]|uniref:Uncharacterized protein n=1 Tax=Tulasnella calospora MUT 4182 TaxID=1051891 RepID=A0A0C3QAT9_9AGAM|nr:hypothetical protein M407DRAFT_243322 [Tulasnella calospora MUT 4182]